jgi:S-adenosylmethionine:tRNA ribosyltransferase-isomerase
VLDRRNGSTAHQIFRDLPGFLRSGDCLVLNDTKVVPARLLGSRADTGKEVELLLLQQEADGSYRCLGQPGKRLKPGVKLVFNHGSITGEVLSSDEGTRLVRLQGEELDKMLALHGRIPLPPYIKRAAEPKDVTWYQTVYAASPGAVAAPTAGLHFTPELLAEIKELGVRIEFVTLHVGWGTFKPVGDEELAKGRLHPERFSVTEQAAEGIRATKKAGGRVIAVGTTAVRTLETAAALSGGELQAAEGTTDLFIREPYQFQVVNGLVTNFHLSGTSLLHLICAFAGVERTKSSYEEAVRAKYRFFSYGDAMLIL